MRRAFTPLEQAPSWKDDLARGIQALGLTPDERVVDQFFGYAKLLQKWGGRINLTSRLDPQQISSIHFLDSLTFLAARHPEPHSSLVDIGSGGGFPGLPVKLVRPDLQVTLLEPSEKKAVFLRTVVHELGLHKISVVRSRAGDSRMPPLGPFDYALCRAVSSLPFILSLALDLVRPRGTLVAYKGPNEAIPGRESLSVSGEWIFAGRSLVAVPGRPSPRALLFFERR